MRLAILSALFLLTACSMQPQSHSVQVEIAPQQFVTLPSPAQLQQSINVSQLISAQWGEKKQQKLLVQLQVDEKQVVLAGFSAWGMKLLSLHYSDQQIQTDVLAGLAESLPKPEQVLFNVMLSIWPVEAWQLPLQKIGWKLQEKGLQRLLLDEKDQVVVIIDYQKKPYLDGKITFQHQTLHYTVIIETD